MFRLYCQYENFLADKQQSLTVDFHEILKNFSFQNQRAGKLPLIERLNQLIQA